MFKVRLVLSALACLTLAACTVGGRPTFTNAHPGDSAALERVLTAREALGGAGRLEAAGGIVLAGEGTYDLGTRMQGYRSFPGEYYPLREQLVVDPASGRVAYESDTHVNADAREWIRYFFDGEGRMLFVERLDGFAFWETGVHLNEQAMRYSNMVPHLIIADAMENHETLEYAGTDADGASRVRFLSSVGVPLTVHFDSASGYPVGVSYRLVVPLKGNVEMAWRFDAYSEVEGLGPYPDGYSVTLDGSPLKRVAYTQRRVGADDAALFTPPADIEIPPRPERIDSPGPMPLSERPLPEPRELAEGVYVFPNVRPGFHHLVVEFDDYLTMVDAPAGWLELHQLPAIQWVEGATVDSVGARFLAAVEASFPGKPVRYVVVTHHHSDHAGGICPFVAAGATVVTTDTTAGVIKDAVARPIIPEADALTGGDFALEMIIVDGEYTLADDNMQLRLIDAGNNPHAAGMLVAWLPKQRILYQSDLFEPIALDVFPNPARVPVMKWFVEWLDASGLNPDRIYAVHGGLRVTEEHLAAIRTLAGRPESDCTQALARHLETDLDLTYEEFDQTMDSGFRALAGMGCQAEAADLIERYIEVNDAPQRSLRWHVAQLRAFTGDYERAIPFARASLNENEVIGPDSLRWNDYVLATIAFLERDRDALIRHRDNVAAGVDDHPGNGMNLRLLDSLIEYFDESYSYALEHAGR